MVNISTYDVKDFPRELAEQYQAVPIGQTEQDLILLCAHLMNEAEITVIENCYHQISDKKLQFTMDKRYNIHKAMEEYYDICSQHPDYQTAFLKAYQELSMESLLMFCIHTATHLNASDIHLISESESFRVKLRIDGILKTLFSVKGSFGQQLIRYIKIQSRIDISRTLSPLEGRFTVNLENETIDIRVSIMPTVIGEKISLRILGINQNIFDLEDIGFNPDEKERIRKQIHHAAGFVLVSGPTGAGKTTTLLALLKEINDGKRNIISIEDPVEYHLDGMTQVSLSQDSKSDYYDILKFTLRQDPDVIMIGEIRDSKTADTGLKAAITGHLVLSSIHTKSSIGALQRLMDLGVPPYIISDSISLIINQRLIRILCPYCKEAYEVPVRTADFVGIKEATILYKAVGCAHCFGTGYIGRKPVFEILEIRDEERIWIKHQRTEELSKAVIPLTEKIKSMLTEGKTSIDEYIKYL